MQLARKGEGVQELPGSLVGSRKAWAPHGGGGGGGEGGADTTGELVLASIQKVHG